MRDNPVKSFSHCIFLHADSMLPKRRFGRSNKPFGEYFRTTFQRVVTESCTHTLEKCFPRAETRPIFLSCLPKSSFGEHQHVADRTDGKSRRHALQTTTRCPPKIRLAHSNKPVVHMSMCNKKQKIDANQSHQICDTVDNASHLEFHFRTFVDAGVPFRTRRAHAQSQLLLYVETMLDVNVPEYAPCFRGRVSCYLPHDALSSFTIPKQNVSLSLPNEDFGKSYKR